MCRKITIKCPTCDTIVTGRKKFFSSNLICPVCKGKINLKRDKIITVICQNCGNTLTYDTTQEGNHECPICKADLAGINIADVEIECPTCHFAQNVKRNEITHKCPHCETSFKVQKAIADREAASGPASIITVPKDNKDIIWKDPKTKFPFASQVMIPGGYTGLLSCNGICSKLSPGIYPLYGSLKTREEQLLSAAIDPNEIVWVDVFFIRNAIDQQIGWTDEAFPVYRNGMKEGFIRAYGTVSLQVVDSEKFAKYKHYEPVKESELFSGCLAEGNESELMEIVRKGCFIAVELFLMSEIDSGADIDELIGSKNIYIEEIRAKVDGRLAEYGLGTSAFFIDELRFEKI